MNRKIKKVWFVAAIIIAILIGGAWWSESTRNGNKADTAGYKNGADNIIEFKDGYFYSNKENFSFKIPGGWDSANQEDFKYILEGIEDPLFFLSKDRSNCVIAYAVLPREQRNSLIQVSFADRIFSKDWQFDGNWYVFKKEGMKKINFSRDNRQYLDGEFRYVGFNINKKAFFLFNKDGGSVADDCNNDMNELLKSMKSYYKTINLNNNSKGSLRVASVKIFFTPENKELNYEVLALPPENFYPDFLIFNNKLYILVINRVYLEDAVSKIISIDPFTKNVVIMPGLEKIDGYVSDIYLHDDSIYYLVAKQPLCLDTSRACESYFYKADLVNENEPELLSDDIVGSKILGYNKEERAFYFADEWGDTGCASRDFSRYIDGKTEIIGSFSGCIGEDEYELAKQTAVLIYDKVGYDRKDILEIGVENGRIFSF